MFQSCITPLYNAGAQNLLVIDVPPRIRPSGEPNPSLAYTQHHWKIKMWNKTIHRKIEDMQVEHPDICIMTFSAWDLFTDIYDNPEKYGFKAEDVDQAYGGKMWMDGLHPTSAVHSIIADHVHSMLSTKDASDV